MHLACRLLDMVHAKFLLDLDAECLGAAGLPAIRTTAIRRQARTSDGLVRATLSGNVEASCSRVSEPACPDTRPHAMCSGCRT
jgi:hypothetical protein